MRISYECSDCGYGALFDGDAIPVCTHPDLPAEESDKYNYGKADASACRGFVIEEPRVYSNAEWDQASEYCERVYGQVSFFGLREWITLRED